MTITKYVYENFTGTGFMWHPVTEEGDVLFYPCGDLIEYQQEDEGNNYGLAFYACGYNGQAQQDFIESWAEEGVSVF